MDDTGAMDEGIICNINLDRSNTGVIQTPVLPRGSDLRIRLTVEGLHFARYSYAEVAFAAVAAAQMKVEVAVK